ncbi:hypothetical protein ACFL5A_04875 [Gemmatimonadota bacterium]
MLSGRKIVTGIALIVALVVACGDDSPTEPSGPEIVACNSVRYQGFTYTNIGCAPGIASFDVDITSGTHSASFHITCSSGCVSTVTVR